MVLTHSLTRIYIFNHFCLLILFISCGINNTALLDTLLTRKTKCDIDAVTTDGRTGLHIACLAGSLDIIQMLLSRTELINKVNIGDFDNWTPLMYAGTRSLTHLLTRLLTHP